MDTRKIITSFNEFPYNAIVAVDYKIGKFTFLGSGITIAPNHVLTAGHIVYHTRLEQEASFLRTTISKKVSTLDTREFAFDTNSDPNSEENVNVPSISNNVNYLADFKNVAIDALEKDPKNYFRDNKVNETDIALLTTTDAPILATDVIGLIAFVNPTDAIGYTIDNAGYPYDNIPDANTGSTGITGNSGVQGTDLVPAPNPIDSPGTIDRTDGRTIFYSPDVNTSRGHSGSGLWHTIKGDNPRVLGVHTRGPIEGELPKEGEEPNFTESDSGVLITKDIYDKIITQIKEDSEGDDLIDNARFLAENALLLPENAIIGSTNSDNIVGSYRQERIIGSSGNDSISGGGSNDRLEGGDGDDILNGENINTENLNEIVLGILSGNDILEGGKGNDRLDGSFGTDVAIFSGDFDEYDINRSNVNINIGIGGIGSLLQQKQWTIEHKNGGIDGTDTLVNIEFAEFNGVIYSLEGDEPELDPEDTIEGSQGNDELDGGANSDIIKGLAGNDTITGGNGGDFLFGEAGHDRLWGGNGNDELDGGDGNDRLRGQKNNDTLIGGNGSDTLEGHNGDDRLWGGKGNDKLHGENDNDVLQGQVGNDTLTGGNGGDTLKGFHGDDRLWGGNGNDKLYGGNDNDILQGQGGKDHLKGGMGNDTLVGGGRSDTLVGGSGADVFHVYYRDANNNSDADLVEDYKLGKDSIYFKGGISLYDIRTESNDSIIYHRSEGIDLAILQDVSIDSISELL